MKINRYAHLWIDIARFSRSGERANAIAIFIECDASVARVLFDFNRI